jgi:hypothetical protein
MSRDNLPSSLFLVILFLAFSRVSFASSKDLISIGVPIPIHHLDPIDLNFLEEWEIYGAIHDSLLEYQVLTGFKPILAESWNIDRQKKFLTFQLKPTLAFSDGTPLTATDVEFSMKRLILLDRTGGLAISRCLKDKSFFRMSQNHRLISVIGPLTIRFGPTDCGEVLLKELAGANYAIVSKKAVSTNWRIDVPGIVSGAFTYKEVPEGLLLSVNKLNWRWKRPKGSIGIGQIHILSSQLFANPRGEAFPRVDAFRTSNPEVLEAAKKEGYQTALSLPSMVWYLRPSPGSLKDLEGLKSLIEDLNLSLDRSRIKAWENNPIERPAVSFFPPEMNCDFRAADEKRAKVHKSQKRKGIVVRLIMHPSGESDLFVNDLKNSIQSLGYAVELISQSNVSKSVDRRTFELFIERQFLTDSTVAVLDMVFPLYKLIPDPGGQITKQLSALDGSDKSIESTRGLTRLCSDFAQYYHVPLAHRKYAFIYRGRALAPLFSKGNGNLILTNFANNMSGEN